MNTYRAGIDIGSTTVKLVLLDEEGKLLFGEYRRHCAHTQEALSALLREARERPPDTVPIPDHGTRLEPQHYKSGIPTATPYTLACIALRLPPILYMQCRNPISSCSKAPRGLSVLLRVTGIFTGTTISPSLLSRQCPDRYAFRAGRNLPDKEFRYLRTVIVTAAVYWGLSSNLRISPEPSP